MNFFDHGGTERTENHGVYIDLFNLKVNHSCYLMSIQKYKNM